MDITLPLTYAALCQAIDDEYKARATYRAVIAVFGPVLPFSNIVQSEERHIAALSRHFHRFGWKIPNDLWHGTITAPDTVAEACRIGIQAEIDNAELYDRLLTMTSDRDILSTFDNLRSASVNRHLPAFKRHMNRSGNATHHHLADA